MTPPDHWMIPDKPHPRAIRTATGWLVRRTTTRTVRVTSDFGYIDVRLGAGATLDDATRLADTAIVKGTPWTRVPKVSGPSGGSSAARAPDSGLKRVEAYLRPEAADALARLMRHPELTSARAAIEWALTHTPPKP